MATLGNSPTQEIVLRLEARKSFALGIYLTDSNSVPLDISNTSIRLVVRKSLTGLPTGGDDSLNLVASSSAELVTPEVGYARFNLQGSDLAWKPGEYPFNIVLVEDGYSAVLVSGVIDLVQNTEFDSAAETYAGVNPGSALSIALRGTRTVEIQAGHVLAPGTTSFSDTDKAKLDALKSVSPNELLPSGGTAGQVLQRVGGGVEWSFIATGEGSPLPADGVTAGYVPVSNGAGGWTWGLIEPLTTEQATKLASLTRNYTELDNLPTLGTAAAAAVTDFRAAGSIPASDIGSGVLSNARIPKLTGLLGWTAGTAAPSGGADGDVYFQYTV